MSGVRFAGIPEAPAALLTPFRLHRRLRTPQAAVGLQSGRIRNPLDGSKPGI